MNFKIIEKSLLPLFIAAIFIVAFNWQFTYTYTFLIEHFKEDKLSILYAHLFIYSFLVFTIFLFCINLVNELLKSKIFISAVSITLFLFYAFSYEPIIKTITYFINYPLTGKELIFMILFVVSNLIYGLYSLAIIFFNKFVPFSHSFVFLGLSLAYSVYFINFYCYPISTIMTKF